MREDEDDEVVVVQKGLVFRNGDELYGGSARKGVSCAHPSEIDHS